MCFRYVYLFNNDVYVELVFFNNFIWILINFVFNFVGMYILVSISYAQIISITSSNNFSLFLYRKPVDVVGYILKDINRSERVLRQKTQFPTMPLKSRIGGDRRRCPVTFLARCRLYECLCVCISRSVIVINMTPVIGSLPLWVR